MLLLLLLLSKNICDLLQNPYRSLIHMNGILVINAFSFSLEVRWKLGY